ncbi:MAG TPA: endonuclease/exonuclease/phosphatase family protein [Nitrososphaeraceae archaeon]
MTVVETGLLVLGSSMIMIVNAQAQMYNYLYEPHHYNIYPDPKKSSDVNIQKIECFNSNITVNGLDITQIQDGAIVAAGANGVNDGPDNRNTQNGNGFGDQINSDKNLENMYVNVNLNEQVKVNPFEECFRENRLTLMTWNIYQGANQSSIFTATTPSEFVTAVGSAYNRIQATNFIERADSIAEKIQEIRPDLIGLQEVILLRTQIPSDGHATPATNISFDYLQILIDTLAERGLIYEPVVVQASTDIEVPGVTSTGLVDIRFTDRDVLLARANTNFTLSNTNGTQFVAKLPLTTPFGTSNILRAWVSVDVTFDNGDKVRVVSTHLEALSPVIQELQADELIDWSDNTHLPIIFIGDFNSNAAGTGTKTYTKLKDVDFIDAWVIKGKGTGFTCCQADDLLNQNSSLTERIDLVMFRGNFEVKDIGIVGNSQNDRTISGLWPSDHAGVVANLKLNSDKN